MSLGASSRDHAAEVELLGERVRIERIGTNGDLRRAVELVRELDGAVDAIGMGGIDLYVRAGGRRYAFRDAQRMARAAQRTPIVDGSGLKDSLERRLVGFLQDELQMDLAGRRVLMVAAVDRFGMAEELARRGADVVFGDLMFGLGIPIPLRSLRQLERVAFVALPVITRLPFKWLYPVGEKQEEVRPRHVGYFRWADVIAGDFHFIRRSLPPDLSGKVIVTNTITPRDTALLRERGVARVITSTPNLGGRSFGTNVIEAVLVALSGRRPDELTPSDYLSLLDRIGFRPRVEEFSSAPLSDRPDLAAQRDG
ncbi:MAG TPA: quinate 5-dehydrogenase [Limnochordia bacterium]